VLKKFRVMGKSLLPGCWEAAHSLCGLALWCALLLGCDARDSASLSDPEQAPTSSRVVSDTEMLLPNAPWFELPEGWQQQHPVLSPNAKSEAHWIGLAEAEIERNPADGSGRAWLESVRPVDSRDDASTWLRSEASEDRPLLEASSYHRFEIGFEVGEFGIDEGGVIFLTPEPFWYWSEAQSGDPRAPGYTTARARVDGVELRADFGDAAFTVAGRALEPGERIDFTYGAGEPGAQVDRYAERGAEIMIGVDADGDGVRAWIDESVRVDISAQPGVQLLAFGPAEITPGAAFEIVVSLTDPVGNRARWPEDPNAQAGVSVGHFAIHVLEDSSLGLEGAASPRTARSAPDAPMRLSFTPKPGEGTIRLRIEGREDLAEMAFDLPPIVVRKAANRLVWGDLHGHTSVSDGTGTPHDYFAYARDVARLDVVALTDHDHWGLRPLDERPDVAADLLATAHSFNRPGHFITIPGYEWTNWLHGHRHVLYFDREAPIFSALDPRTDRPDELWNALRGLPALTLAHHSAGEPVATNWLFAPDPELEPLTEIASVHGVSEALDAPNPVLGGIPGNFVRDTLMRGVRLGFIGSGDSHDGHPGLAQIAAGQAGLAGIFTPVLDRPGLLGAMRRRHTFATNGIRPWLEVHIDDTVMGGTLATDSPPYDGDEAPGHVLRVRYEATSPIERIDLIRSGRVAALSASDSFSANALSLSLERKIPRLAPGEFHYVRILQEDGGLAWSSPIFAD